MISCVYACDTSHEAQVVLPHVCLLWQQFLAIPCTTVQMVALSRVRRIQGSHHPTIVQMACLMLATYKDLTILHTTVQVVILHSCCI